MEHRPLSNVLNYVLLEVTDDCNFSCEHCRVGKIGVIKDPLTYSEIKDLIIQATQLGAKVITFSGGEPLLRNDIIEIVNFASSQGLKTRIQSNGYLLTPDLIKRLKSAGLNTFGTGLDGSCAEIHNKLRRNPLAFEKAISAIKLAISEGIEVHVETTVTNYNKNDIEEIINLAKELGASTFLCRCVVLAGKASNKLMISKTENKLFLEKVCKKKYSLDNITITSQDPLYHLVDFKLMNQLKEKYGPLDSSKFCGGCVAGFNSLNVKSNGDVQICTFLPIIIGNIRKNRLIDIWENRHFTDYCQNFIDRDIGGNCKTCEDRFICGGCRARALAVNKNILGEDPYCWKNEK